MTDDELRQLAEIAGLKTHYHNGKLHAFDDKRNFYEAWDPPNKINQAIMVAEHWPLFGIWKTDHGYGCRLFQRPDKLVGEAAGHENVAASICHAALAAKEG